MPGVTVNRKRTGDYADYAGEPQTNVTPGGKLLRDGLTLIVHVHGKTNRLNKLARTGDHYRANYTLTWRAENSENCNFVSWTGLQDFQRSPPVFRTWLMGEIVSGSTIQIRISRI